MNPNFPTNPSLNEIFIDNGKTWKWNGVSWVALSNSSLAPGNVPIASTGSTEARTLADRFADVVNVKDFGAVGDGVADDTGAIRDAATSITDGKTLYFPNGTYLISSTNATTWNSVFGKTPCYFTDVDNIRVIGDGATIKVVSHDISANGGLTAFVFENCNGATVSGFNFHMTFIGYKSSSAYNPFNGAIFFTNTSSIDGQNPDDLSGDILVEHCEFKLFHPLGCFGVNNNPANYYNGDPNNAFKIFSVFVSSPYLADQYENAGRNCTIRDCRIKEGHNAYGFWVWATYNAVFDNLVAESFVTKATIVDTLTFKNTPIPFIRHHQFRTEGAKVTNCYFRARPSSERTELGFEGSGEFIHFTTNIDGDLAKGEYIVANNIITHSGNNSGSNTVSNVVILAYGYGNYIFDGNTFDGHDGEDNTGTGIFLATGNGSTNGGVSSVIISNNTWGKWSRTNNIHISPGTNDSAYSRRYQQVSITGNLSLAQNNNFLFLGNTSNFTFEGVQSLNVSNNIIDGTYSNVPSSDANSRAIYLKGNQATDSYVITHNIIRSKNCGVFNSTTNTKVNTFGNKFIDVTNNFLPNNTTEIISGTTQGPYHGIFEGENESQITANEILSGKSISLYAQSNQQYILADSLLYFYAEGNERIALSSSHFYPVTNGGITLGTGAFKFGQIYSTVGTISTSDERKKQNIANLEQAELNVATALKGLFRKFKYKSAVVLKGDNARTHIGVIAQEVKAAFEAEGLNPFEYGILCLDKWDNQYSTNLKHEQVLIQEAGEEYSIRYDELFAFIIAAL